MTDNQQRAAKVLRPFEELFAGGPDTVCRTVWREDPGLIGEPSNEIECVEVPMADLRDAFDQARALVDEEGTE
jgi:hypothetical protein